MIDAIASRVTRRRKPFPVVVAAAATCVVMLSAACTARVGDPVVPAPPDLSTPVSTVRSYLAWNSLAYRMVDSDLASVSADPNELVHVDSYIQLNREKRQGLEQSLTEFRVRADSVDGTRAVVSTDETWRYRYFSIDSYEYRGPQRSTSYEVTYTVGRDAASRWRVLGVEARPLGRVY